MSIAIIAPTRDTSIWVDQLKKLDSSLKVEVYPEIEDPDKITCAVVWLYPHGELKRYINLKIICSMGAGVDHILKDNNLPKVPITRVVSERLAFSMNTYVAMAVLNYHRKMDKYVVDQQNKQWDQAAFPERDLKIGVYGFGYLGCQIGMTLRNLGFEVHGFSRSKKLVEGINTYGQEEEFLFLQNINVLIGVLPMTGLTKGIFSKQLFNKLKQPTYFINVGRGNQQIEDDIVEAIDEGILTGAMLDVFMKEPLDKSSKLWDHQKITITPHIAGITNPDAAVPQIYKNYIRMTNNELLLNEVNPENGY